jgi:RNA 3'-terminal phosphate cyclase (ATP)
MLTLEFEHLSNIVTGFGERGLSAQAVAKRAVEAATRYLRTPAAVGHHLADQLLLLMALAGSGRFTTLRPSLHTRTNVIVIRQFLPVDISLKEIERGLWQVTVGG